jgi:hypothetical protein
MIHGGEYNNLRVVATSEEEALENHYGYVKLVGYWEMIQELATKYNVTVIDLINYHVTFDKLKKILKEANGDRNIIFNLLDETCDKYSNFF